MPPGHQPAPTLPGLGFFGTRVSTGGKAGDGIRTHDNNVGNVVLYQLSYARAAPLQYSRPGGPCKSTMAPSEGLPDPRGAMRRDAGSCGCGLSSARPSGQSGWASCPTEVARSAGRHIPVRGRIVRGDQEKSRGQASARPRPSILAGTRGRLSGRPAKARAR